MERRGARRREEANPGKPDFFSIELETEFGRAWKQYVLDKGTKRTKHFRAWLEGFLVQQGYLKVHVIRDPKTGKESKRYEVLRKEER